MVVKNSLVTWRQVLGSHASLLYGGSLGAHTPERFSNHPLLFYVPWWLHSYGVHGWFMWCIAGMCGSQCTISGAWGQALRAYVQTVVLFQIARFMGVTDMGPTWSRQDPVTNWVLF